MVGAEVAAAAEQEVVASTEQTLADMGMMVGQRTVGLDMCWEAESADVSLALAAVEAWVWTGLWQRDLRSDREWLSASQHLTLGCAIRAVAATEHSAGFAGLDCTDRRQIVLGDQQ